ncbi:hypothetical protein CI238_02960 [Colletotrichum incanum]|uniref:Uncharacterized protein n=1 Tax=Colletotrichum incanum TaxID=1573173 RepID=A0A167EHM6_COLIC|nr:hypothetical protein CI238_02960 [Colletotrichum incanum]
MGISVELCMSLSELLCFPCLVVNLHAVRGVYCDMRCVASRSDLGVLLIIHLNILSLFNLVIVVLGARRAALTRDSTARPRETARATRSRLETICLLLRITIQRRSRSRHRTAVWVRRDVAARDVPGRLSTSRSLAVLLSILVHALASLDLLLLVADLSAQQHPLIHDLAELVAALAPGDGVRLALLLQVADFFLELLEVGLLLPAWAQALSHERVGELVVLLTLG